MTPKAFIQSLQQGNAPAGVLLLGNEGYNLDRCRSALRKAALGLDEGAKPAGDWTEYDLAEQPLRELLDDARTLSLFGGPRVIQARRVEGALPRTPSKAADPVVSVALKDYFAEPTPGVVLLFEATRYDWAERDQQSRLERIVKLFSTVPVVVELRSFTPLEAAAEAGALAKELELKMPSSLLGELVEMLGGNMARIAGELRKLSLYAEAKGDLDSADIELLVPEARQRGVFELTDALAAGKAAEALGIVDTMERTGVYWPMQLSLLANLFRQALAVREGGARSPSDVVALFKQRGQRMWASRARQLLGVASRLPADRLYRTLHALYEADRDLRRESPGDRLIIEKLVLEIARAA